jgi:hypothetical protein
MRSGLLFLLLVCLPALGSQYQYPGTNLRGQILTINGWGQQVPLAYAKVDLYFFNQQFQQLQFLSSTNTDGYGFFFFRSVSVNNYVIYVNGAKYFNIRVVPIDYRFYQYQDLGSFFY